MKIVGATGLGGLWPTECGVSGYQLFGKFSSQFCHNRLGYV